MKQYAETEAQRDMRRTPRGVRGLKLRHVIDLDIDGVVAPREGCVD